MPRSQCYLFSLLLCLAAISPRPARAEGSRNLYPASYSSSGVRTNLEWTTDTYGGLLKRRTLLSVYAQQGEYILVGSSAVGVAGTSAPGPGDVLSTAPAASPAAWGRKRCPLRLSSRRLPSLDAARLPRALWSWPGRRALTGPATHPAGRLHITKPPARVCTMLSATARPAMDGLLMTLQSRAACRPWTRRHRRARASPPGT